jgi:hypothetical protein
MVVQLSLLAVCDSLYVVDHVLELIPSREEAVKD